MQTASIISFIFLSLTSTISRGFLSTQFAFRVSECQQERVYNAMRCCCCRFFQCAHTQIRPCLVCCYYVPFMSCACVFLLTIKGKIEKVHETKQCHAVNYKCIRFLHVTPIHISFELVWLLVGKLENTKINTLLSVSA